MKIEEDTVTHVLTNHKITVSFKKSLFIKFHPRGADSFLLAMDGVSALWDVSGVRASLEEARLVVQCILGEGTHDVCVI